MNTEEISLRVVEILNAHHVPYMLVGSLSTNFHSAPRSTKNADIVVQAELGETAHLIARECAELRLDPQYGFKSVTATQKIVLREETEGFVVELFGLSDDPHDQARFQRRKLVDWDGRPTWIASVEDAIITKLRWAHIAARRKDIDDARNVILAKGQSLDWHYIESWSEQHGSRRLLEQIREELRQK